MEWTPSKEWEGQDAHLIGGGSSLDGFDFSVLVGRNTIGCNSAFRLGPQVVKICLFGDTSWWQKNKWDLEKFKGRVISCASGLGKIKIPGILQIPRIRDGLHVGPRIGWNYSTGAAAINLAISLGAVRIFLLGYDMTDRGGKTHWHSYYAHRTQISSFQRFSRGFFCVAKHLPRFPGVEVLNVTDGSSKLTVFPRITPEQWKEGLQ